MIFLRLCTGGIARESHTTPRLAEAGVHLHLHVAQELKWTAYTKLTDGFEPSTPPPTPYPTNTSTSKTHEVQPGMINGKPKMILGTNTRTFAVSPALGQHV